MRDAEIEGAAQHGARVFEVIHAAEVVPQSERHGGKLDAAAPRAAILHGVVTLVVSDVHEDSPQRLKAPLIVPTYGAAEAPPLQNRIKTSVFQQSFMPHSK